MTLLDKAAELEKEWETRYRELKKKERTPTEDMEMYKLKVRLGYALRSGNQEIECEGCG